MSNRKLFVLAGGFGTRLKNSIPNVPKPLAPIGQNPFLELQIKNWISQGINSFIFLLHHQADLIVDFLICKRDSLLKNCEVSWVIEKTPLDTGGSIANAIRKLSISGNFLVINADTWLTNGLSELSFSSPPAIGIYYLKNTTSSGRITFDSNQLVLSFSEKIQEKTPGWINAGVAHLSTDNFTGWDESTFSLEKKLYPELIKQKILKAIPITGEFLDIGTPNNYHLFKTLASLKKVKNVN